MAGPLLPAPDRDTKRVSVRVRTSTGALSDVVGHLIAANREWLVVLPPDRGAIWVAQHEVEAIREIPERTVRPESSAEALELLLDQTWPGIRRARLGGWVLRAAHGRSNRANSTLLAGTPEIELSEAIALAEQWYGSPITFQAVAGSAQAQALLQLGYRAHSPSLVLVRAASEPAKLVGLIHTTESADPAWRRIFHNGQSDVGRIAELEASPATYLRLGELAVGRMARSGHWAVLSCIEVVPDARGQGLGAEMTLALMAAARSAGARYLALQVEADNQPALHLYRKLGFVEHHSYCYLAVPSAK